jgi:hypothetical protein
MERHVRLGQPHLVLLAFAFDRAGDGTRGPAHCVAKRRRTAVEQYLASQVLGADDALLGGVAEPVLALVLLVALHYRLGDLPFAVWSEARRERQDNAPLALDLLTEAVAKKAGVATVSIRQHEEALAARYAQEAREAQARARASQAQTGDTLTALQAAAELVREQRQLLDRFLRATPPASREPSPPPLPSAVPEDDDRSSEELTTVVPRPLLSELTRTMVSTGNDGGKR